MDHSLPSHDSNYGKLCLIFTVLGEAIGKLDPTHIAPIVMESAQVFAWVSAGLTGWIFVYLRMKNKDNNK